MCSLTSVAGFYSYVISKSGETRHLGLSFIHVVLFTAETLALLKFVNQEELRSHRENFFFIVTAVRIMKV